MEGRFKTREFEGRDGQKRTSLEITADSIVNLERRNARRGGLLRRPRPAPAGSGSRSAVPAAAVGGGGGNVRPTRAPSDDTDLDDLPF